MRLIFQISVLLPDTIFQVIFLMFSFITQILGCHVLFKFLGDINVNADAKKYK